MHFCKENPTHSLPFSHSIGNNREHTAGSSVGNFCPRRSVGVSAPNVPQHLPNENIWLWVLHAQGGVYKWLGGKKTDKIESSDKISSQESLKTCTK